MLAISAIALVFVSCSDKKNAYTLTGTLVHDNVNGHTVYLQKYNFDSKDWYPVDSTKVENESFQFKGIASDTPSVMSIRVLDADIQTSFIAQPGTIRILDDTASFITSVTGTPLNDDYNKVQENLKMMIDKARDFQDRVKEAREKGGITKELYNEYLERATQQPDAYVKSAFDFVKPNITNPVGEYYFLDLSYNFTPEQLKELLAMTTPQFRETERVKKLEKRIAAKEAVSIGKLFTDIKGKDLKGKEISLSDYAGKGKIVLVDFWASWCGPCIRSLPSIVALQEKYKGKNLQIIGVSLDADKKEWEDASKQYKVTWPQLSNLKGWEDEAAKAYGVSGIPHTVLIDKKGIIVDKDISPDFLSFKIEEMLKK